jgi:hypothetical protein
MPQLAPVVVAALISAGATVGTTLGSDFFSGFHADKQPAPTAPLTTAQNTGQAAAVTQQLPTLQSLTGGSLSPEYAASVGAVNSGVGNSPQSTGNIQSAINNYFGLTAPGDTGLNPAASGVTGGPGITSFTGSNSPPSTGGSAAPDIMSLLRSGSGNGMGAWVKSVLDGNQFSGLQQG